MTGPVLSSINCSPMLLREASIPDIPGMHRVRLAVRENRLAPTTRISEADYAPAITDTGRGWVVEVDKVIVAFAVGCKTDGNVWALFVHPDHEGKGYGRQLLARVIEWLWQQNLDRLWLTTGPGTRAEAFYRKAGWRDCGMTEKGELRFELFRTMVVA